MKIHVRETATYRTPDVLSDEEFIDFCRVHDKSATRLGAFVRTACQLHAALEILKKR